MTDARQWLRDKLATYEQLYGNVPSEALTINKARTFIDQNANCFQRTNLEGHITGSAWIVNETFDACLLMHHRKLGLWLQPGGHADGDWNVFRVALKEAQEETGILDLSVLSEEIFDLDIHSFPARESEPEHLHFDVRFLFQSISNAPSLSSNNESFSLAWVSIEEVLKNSLYENVRKMANKTKILISLGGNDENH